MMWILFTEGAALCMAFAAVMAKTGSKHGNYALSVAVAGTVLCVLSYFTSVKPITLHAIMKLQDLFQRVGSLHQVANVLELHLQHQSFQ